MASVLFRFADNVSLYNAVSLANNLTGNHSIEIRYAPNYSPLSSDVSNIDTDKDGSLNQAEIDAFINATSGGAITINPVSGGKLIRPENLKISAPVSQDKIGNVSIGVAPRIKKSMTLDFLSQSGEHYAITNGSRLELISKALTINPRPYSIASDLTAAAYFNYFSGLKVDDGDPNNQIDVTIKNLKTSNLGTNFWKIDFGPDQSPVEYADFGAIVDNHEDLTLENYTHDSYWAIGKNAAATPTAPILNKPGAALTVTGQVVSGQAFQYGQSLLYNQGTANLSNAQLNIYDISKPAVPAFYNAFGGASRATGAITNAFGAQLSINDSRVSQESADRSGEYTTEQIKRNLGEQTGVNSPQIPPTEPKSLEHIVLNYGTLTAQDSEIAGIIINEGTASFGNTKVGLSKSNTLNGSNLVLRGGNTQLTQSTVDNIERSGSGTLNQTNSVVIKGYGSGAVSAYLVSLLDPSRPTLFSDATTPPNGDINPFVYQSYDGSRLNPALLSAVNAILSGSGSGSGGGSPSSPAVGGGSPHITSIVTSYGSLIDASEKNSQQTIAVFTEDVPNGSTLVLILNGTAYTSQANNNQASFLLPPADLALLPPGINHLEVTGTSNGVTIPAATQSFSVDGAAPAAIPHITSIASSFGANLDSSELAAPQTLAVTTTGIEAGQVLTLQIDGQPAPAGVSGGSVDAAGTASFNLPVSVLSSLAAGLHQFSVSGSNQSGTSAPRAALAFSVEGPGFVPSPHITSVSPSFGSLLDTTEVGNAQSVVVTTEGVPDSTTLNLAINSSNTYTAVVSSNTASFSIPAGDLSGLSAGIGLLRVGGNTATGTLIPTVSQSFSVDGPAPSSIPHILDIDPAFGSVLDSNEAATNQAIRVITTGLSDGQALELQLNGLQYNAVVSSDHATFNVPTADLQALPVGTDTLLVNAPGTATPQGSQSFTKTAASSAGGSIGGGGTSPGGGGSSIGSGTSSSGISNNPASNPGLDNDNLDESPANHNGLIIDGNKDGIADATQSNVAGLRRTGDGTSAGDYAALAVGPSYTLNAVTLLPITNNQVQVSLPSGGTITTPIPTGISALLEPLEFYVEGVTPGATIEAELFIPDNFNEQTDAYMRFNYRTQRFEEYVDSNGQKLYQLLDENADGRIDRVVFSLTDGDTDWDGDRKVNGVIIDPGSPIDATLDFKGSNKRDRITGNLLSNIIRGKGGNDRIDGGLGRDVIRGEKGNDRITGGEHGDLLNGGHGKDRFIYHSAADSSADNPYQQDQISDFQKNDRIDLRHFDADPSKAGTQHFHFIGKRFFTGKTGQLRFDSGLLSADIDGDKIADFAVAVDGNLNSRQLLLGA